MRDLIIYPIVIKFDQDNLYFKNKGSSIGYYLFGQLLMLLIGVCFGFAIFKNFVIALVCAFVAMGFMHLCIKKFNPPEKSIIDLKNKNLTLTQLFSGVSQYRLIDSINFISYAEYSIKSGQHVRHYFSNICCKVTNPKYAQETKLSESRVLDIVAATLPGKIKGVNQQVQSFLQYLISDYQNSGCLEASFRKLRKQTDEFDQLIYGKYIGQSIGQYVINQCKVLGRLLPYILIFVVIYLFDHWIY